MNLWESVRVSCHSCAMDVRRHDYDFLIIMLLAILDLPPVRRWPFPSSAPVTTQPLSDVQRPRPCPVVGSVSKVQLQVGHTACAYSTGFSRCVPGCACGHVDVLQTEMTKGWTGHCNVWHHLTQDSLAVDASLLLQTNKLFILILSFGHCYERWCGVIIAFVFNASSAPWLAI